MLLARLSFLFLFCLLGGCEPHSASEDFGEVIYEIPEIRDAEPAADANGKK